jgi:anti-sigma B factor antagonist
MAGSSDIVFLVDAYSDPVLIKIRGRASFANSGSIRDFMSQEIKEGKRRFVFEFSQCSGMDSTFLGVLAGSALELRKKKPAGSLVFCGLGARNLELIRNLGLHRLATVDVGDSLTEEGNLSALNQGDKMGELEGARLCLSAHENLVEADQSNESKFQDVLTLLKNRVDQK